MYLFKSNLYSCVPLADAIQIGISSGKKLMTKIVKIVENTIEHFNIAFSPLKINPRGRSTFTEIYIKISLIIFCILIITGIENFVNKNI